MRHFLLVLTILSLLVSCSLDIDSPTTESPKTGSLTGQVYEYGATLTPLAGVTVKSGSSTTTTDDAGVFSFNNIEAGQNITVEFKKDGYLDVSKKTVVQTLFTRKIFSCMMKYSTVTINPTVQTVVALAAAGNPTLSFPDSAIVDANNQVPANAIVKLTTAHISNGSSNFVNAIPGGSLVADSLGVGVSVKPIGLINLQLESGKGSLSIKTGAKVGASMSPSKGFAGSDSIRLFYFDGGVFKLSADQIITAAGLINAQLSKTGIWLFAKIVDNNPPIADIQVTPKTGPINTFFFFDARNSFDPDGDQFQSKWSVKYTGQDTTYSWSSEYASNLTAGVKLPIAGIYRVELFVRDTKGDMDTAAVEVTVTSSRLTGIKTKK